MRLDQRMLNLLLKNKTLVWNVFLVAFVAVMCVLPFRLEPRVAFPQDLSKATKSSVMTIPSAQLSELQFNVPIVLEYSEAGGRHVSMDELRNPELLNTLIKPSQQLNHQVFRLAFDLANSTLPCSAIAVVDGKLLNGECKNYGARNFLEFPLTEAIMPGLHNLKFEKIAGQFELYAYKSDSEYWLAAFSATPFNTAVGAFWVWWNDRTITAICYLVILALALGTSSAVFKLPVKLSLAILACCAVLGSVFSSTLLFGHDETAQLDSMHSAAMVASGYTPEEAIAAKPVFYKDFRQVMVNSDFHRYHAILLQDEANCPHAVVIGCFDTFRYASYKYFYGLWKIIGAPDAKEFSVTQMAWIGRLANLAILALGLVLIGYLNGASVAISVLCLLPFLGAILGQVGSATNDILLYMIGLVFVGNLLGFFYKTQKKSDVVVLVSCLLAILALVTDRIGIFAFFPMFAVVVLYFLSRRAVRLDAPLLPTLARAVVLLAVCFLGVRYSYLAAAKWVPGFRDFLAALPDEMHRINFIGSMSLFYSIKAFFIMMKSMLGSFIWGHSYYGLSGYVVLISEIVAICATGIWLLKKEKLGPTQVQVLYAVAILIAIHLLINEGLGGRHFFSPHQSERDSLLKPRLSAPMIGSVWTLIGICIYKLIATKNTARILAAAISVWVLMLLFYWELRIFIGDAL